MGMGPKTTPNPHGRLPDASLGVAHGLKWWAYPELRMATGVGGYRYAPLTIRLVLRTCTGKTLCRIVRD